MKRFYSALVQALKDFHRRRRRATTFPNRLSQIVKTSPILSRITPLRYLQRFRVTAAETRNAATDPIRITTLSDADMNVISSEDRKQDLAAQYATRVQSKLISIIIPTRNRHDTFLHAIASVRLQSYANWHLIIVDDASADDTKRLVAGISDDRVSYLRLDQHVGSASARNAGKARAEGSVLAYLDDDNQWDPDYLLLSLNAMRDAQKRMLYSAQLVWSRYDSASGLGQGFDYLLFTPFDRSRLELYDYISMIACIRSLFDRRVRSLR
jgi:O-antigen biosynthesis protein